MTQQKSPTGSNPQGKKRNVNVMDDGMNTTRFPLAGQGFSGCVPCANCPIFASSGSARPSSATSADVIGSGLRRAVFTSAGKSRRGGTVMRSLLTLPGTFGNSGAGAENSSTKVCQHLKHGSFFGVRTLEKHGVYTAIPAGNVANRIPCKGEYARRSLTVFGSRLFLRPAESQPKKSTRFTMFRFFLSSRYLRLRHRLLSLLSTLAGRTAATLVFGAVLALPVLYFVEVL